MEDSKKNRIQEASRKFGLTDKVEIQSGMVVSYTNPETGSTGWYRVRKCTKNFVNLGSIFGNNIYFKSVPKHQVTEDEAAWYARWQQSETYMSM